MSHLIMARKDFAHVVERVPGATAMHVAVALRFRERGKPAS